METRISNLEALTAEAARFAASLAPRAGATLVALSGELGAGKTAFTQAFAKALGVADTVTSPTFVLEKVYGLPEGGTFRKLIHIDAYRLKEGRELAALGFEELMKDAGNVVMLEWPERVADALPTPAATLRIVPEADGSRTISYA